VKVVKNKLAPPFREAEFDVRYGSGIDRAAELIDMGVELGVIDKSGSHLSFAGTHLGNGRERVRETLLADAALAARITEAVRIAAAKTPTKEVSPALSDAE
jgi:recombination protein RecA